MNFSSPWHEIRLALHLIFQYSIHRHGFRLRETGVQAGAKLL